MSPFVSYLCELNISQSGKSWQYLPPAVSGRLKILMHFIMYLFFVTVSCCYQDREFLINIECCCKVCKQNSRNGSLELPNDWKTAENLANFSKLCGNPSCVTVSGIFWWTAIGFEFKQCMQIAHWTQTLWGQSVQWNDWFCSIGLPWRCDCISEIGLKVYYVWKNKT